MRLVKAKNGMEVRDLGHVVIVQVNPVIGLLIGGEGLLEWTKGENLFL